MGGDTATMKRLMVRSHSRLTSAARVSHGTRALLVLFAVLLGSRFLVLASAPPAGREISGMWVWSSDAFGTPAQRTQLLAFCQNHKFNHLDVHLRIEEGSGVARLAD